MTVEEFTSQIRHAILNPDSYAPKECVLAVVQAAHFILEKEKKDSWDEGFQEGREGVETINIGDILL